MSLSLNILSGSSGWQYLTFWLTHRWTRVISLQLRARICRLVVKSFWMKRGRECDQPVALPRQVLSSRLGNTYDNWVCMSAWNLAVSRLKLLWNVECARRKNEARSCNARNHCVVARQSRIRSTAVHARVEVCTLLSISSPIQFARATLLWTAHSRAVESSLTSSDLPTQGQTQAASASGCPLDIWSALQENKPNRCTENDLIHELLLSRWNQELWTDAAPQFVWNLRPRRMYSAQRVQMHPRAERNLA